MKWIVMFLAITISLQTLAQVKEVKKVSMPMTTRAKKGIAAICPIGVLHCSNLSWIAPVITDPTTQTAPTNYNIYRALDATSCTTQPFGIGCKQIGQVPATVTVFTDSPLAATTTYYWVVTSFSNAGSPPESGPSNQVVGLTQSDPFPQAPTLTGVTK